MSNLMSINEAAQQGIERLRLPNWVNIFDHLKIDIVELEDGYKEPRLWAKFYSPSNLELNGQDPFPVFLLTMGLDKIEWEQYTGALPDSDEYKAKQESFKGMLEKGKQ